MAGLKKPTIGDFVLRALLGWESWKIPNQEYLELDTYRDFTEATAAGDVEWPWPNLRITGSKLYKCPRNGVLGGTPMQLGDGTTRQIRWGRPERGEAYKAQIPRPALGAYWPRAYPASARLAADLFDRHLIIQDPTDGTIHEILQWDEDAPIQARRWGHWAGKTLVAGSGTATAGALPLHRYVWTPWSRNAPHVLAIVVPDYVGADGLLNTGPRTGQRVVLDPTSPSAVAMIRAGGECAEIARALIQHGAVIIDRNGYLDTGAFKIGSNPNAPSLHIQTGGLWATSNIHRLDIRLGDLVATDVPDGDPGIARLTRSIASDTRRELISAF